MLLAQALRCVRAPHAAQQNADRPGLQCPWCAAALPPGLLRPQPADAGPETGAPWPSTTDAISSQALSLLT